MCCTSCGSTSREAAGRVVKVVAVVCWFEEPPSWLAALVASLAGLVEHVVAVDGCYSLYPGSGRRPVSGPEQAETILATATGLGMGCSIVRPARAWAGDEVEKRSAAFRAAMAVATPVEDWLLVLDADEVVSPCRPDVILTELAAASTDVATVDHWQRHVTHPLPGEAGTEWHGTEGAQQARRFFRADETLRVEGAHYVYVVGDQADPRFLWGHERFHELEPAAHIGLRVEHRQEFRGAGRRRAQEAYYTLRDRAGTENPAVRVS
jgi:hypothetical protein